MNKEVWQSIKNFPNYLVSDWGRVKSIRTNYEKILKPSKTTGGYWIVVLQNPKTTRRVHRLVAETFIGVPLDKTVDHINGDKDNNSLENLRVVTLKENIRSRGPQKDKTSQFKGVYKTKGGKWYSQIKVGDKNKHLGFFSDEKLAAKMYNTYAKKLYKQFAYLNQI